MQRIARSQGHHEEPTLGVRLQAISGVVIPFPSHPFHQPILQTHVQVLQSGAMYEAKGMRSKANFDMERHALIVPLLRIPCRCQPVASGIDVKQ